MSGWVPQQTADGSYTFFSDTFGEAFHSHQGAKTEAVLKFAVATGLAQKAQGSTVRLLDVCYGLGYNTAAALEVIWASHADCRVELYGLELDPTVPTAATAPDLLQSCFSIAGPLSCSRWPAGNLLSFSRGAISAQVSRAMYRDDSSHCPPSTP